MQSRTAYLMNCIERLCGEDPANTAEVDILPQGYVRGGQGRYDAVWPEYGQVHVNSMLI